MKKNKTVASLALIVMLMLSSVNVYAAKNERKNPALNGIIVNDHIVYSDAEPYIKNSRTYVPIRFIAEELGYDVQWDSKEKMVTMNSSETSVELKIGSDNMKVNDKDVKLDSSPEIKNSRTFVPLRAIAEAFGKKVDYSNEYRTVYIGDNPKYDAFYKIVYYYGKEDKMMSQYTINIAKKSEDIDGNKKEYKTINELVNSVYDSLYSVIGSNSNDVSSKTKPDTSKPKTDTSKPKANANKSNVPDDMKLKDAKYISPSSDPLVGTWYSSGKLTFNGSTVNVRNYKYIESLGDNLYKITTRIILSSDPSSEFYCEQIGYFNNSTNIIEFPDESEIIYGDTGYFKGQTPYLPNEEWVLDKSGTKLYFKSLDSGYYFTKY
ncbi:copper amine oxidase domain protein [Clostridiales bacterium KA00134]|nr:copper amine oxidase domain protein [Clostridiales bacterium KA00134]